MMEVFILICAIVTNTGCSNAWVGKKPLDPCGMVVTELVAVEVTEEDILKNYDDYIGCIIVEDYLEIK